MKFKFVLVYLKIALIFQLSSLSAMETSTKDEYDSTDNPLIANVITIHNYTNRQLEAFIIPNGVAKDWHLEKNHGFLMSKVTRSFLLMNLAN